VWAVGDSGAVHYYDGKVWAEVKSPTKKTLFAVICRSEKEIHVAGSDGIIFQYTGSGWKKLKAPSDVTIYSLALYRDSLYAAAVEDGVYILNPKGLEKIKDLEIHELRTIGGYLLAAGNSLIAQYDGSGWWGDEMGM
jgi:hypothetical protein